MKYDLNRVFLDLHDRYAPALLRHILFRVGEKQAAEDILQEVFLRTFRFVESNGVKPRSYKKFLYKVANNLIIDHYRQKYKAGTFG